MPLSFYSLPVCRILQQILLTISWNQLLKSFCRTSKHSIGVLQWIQTVTKFCIISVNRIPWWGTSLFEQLGTSQQSTLLSFYHCGTESQKLAESSKGMCVFYHFSSFCKRLIHLFIKVANLSFLCSFCCCYDSETFLPENK